jgi:hypothetical protein
MADDQAADRSPLDEDGAAPDETSQADERPVDRFRRTAVGSVVAASLFGLRDALEGRPEHEEVTIVSAVPTRDEPDRLDVQLDGEHPERSVVVVHRRDADPPPDPTG